MELKDLTKWDDFCTFLDAAYIPMVKNGIQPVRAITDPTTFETLQDALFEAFFPNEKPNRDTTTIELSFPFIGTLPVTRGEKNCEPYLFFVNG